MPAARLSRAIGVSRTGLGTLLALTLLIGSPVAILAASPAQAAPAPGRLAPPELSKGDQGEAVKVLQRALPVRVTGYFGPVTEMAVEKLQRDNDLEATGVVDNSTWRILGSTVAQAAAQAAIAFASVGANGRYCPAVGFYYGDGYGASRGDHMHEGLDMMGKMGSPIYAVDAGKVDGSGYQSNGAIVMTITAKDGHAWFYGHFSKIVVKDGDVVKAGQLIGYMGDTGAPGAVHLHIELLPNGWNGGAVDPEPLLRSLCGSGA